MTSETTAKGKKIHKLHKKQKQSATSSILQVLSYNKNEHITLNHRCTAAAAREPKITLSRHQTYPNSSVTQLAATAAPVPALAKHTDADRAEVCSLFCKVILVMGLHVAHGPSLWNFMHTICNCLLCSQRASRSPRCVINALIIRAQWSNLL